MKTTIQHCIFTLLTAATANAATAPMIRPARHCCEGCGQTKSSINQPTSSSVSARAATGNHHPKGFFFANWKNTGPG